MNGGLLRGDGGKPPIAVQKHRCFEQVELWQSSNCSQIAGFELDKRSSRFIRGELGNAVDLRYTPELIFVEDRSTERAIALSKTLEKAKVVDE